MIALAIGALAFSGRRLEEDDHDHDHDHGGSAPAAGCTVAYEWGAIFATPGDKTYSWNVYKKDGAWAEPSMKIVALPVSDTTQATLAAQKEVAHEAFEHHCGADELVDVEPGETIIPGDHRCSKLHIEGEAVSIQYTIRLTDAENATVSNLAIFTEHNPSEFEIAGGHYLTSASGEAGSGATNAEDVEPVGATLGAAEPECPSPPATPPPKKDDDNPCFSESATACRLDDASLAPAAAYARCYGAADGGAAARVSMRALKAGDIVLASPTETTRVIVNQHAAVRLSSALLEIEHKGGVTTGGRLALTPDHVLWVDGAFRAAAQVREGSQLLPPSKVTRVGATTHLVVNPITTSGTILAAGPTGSPVVASVFPEWIAHLLLGASLPYPLPLSGAAAVSYLFPASVQAYYDAALEPFFASTASGLKELKAAVPAPAALAILLGFDAALVTGFALWSLSLKGVVALLAVGLVAKARRAKA